MWFVESLVLFGFARLCCECIPEDFSLRTFFTLLLPISDVFDAHASVFPDVSLRFLNIGTFSTVSHRIEIATLNFASKVLGCGVMEVVPGLFGVF